MPRYPVLGDPMCGRFTQVLSWTELHDLFGLIGEPQNLEPRYNVAPTQRVAAVRLDEGERRLVRLRWGLIPFWAKDEKIGYSTINARREDIEKKPAFREAFKKRRCLIPADGFYEWTGAKGDKQPWRIVPKGGGLMAFAGLWERWEKGEAPVETFTIITCAASGIVASLHDRMPVILPPETYGTWLDGSGWTEVLVPAAEGALEAYPVDRRVGSVKNDDPGLIEPVE